MKLPNLADANLANGAAEKAEAPKAAPKKVALKPVDPDAQTRVAKAYTGSDPFVMEADRLSSKLRYKPKLRPKSVVAALARPIVGPVRKGARRVAQLTRKPNFFERAQMRKDKYSPIVAREAKAQGVPVALALAIVEIESSFRPKARGAAGEVGLMQVRPRTARGMGYTGTTKALYDPATNVRWGMRYLAEAYRRGGRTTCGTILKYNAGHYAKRMNPISARYCRRVKKVMAKNT